MTGVWTTGTNSHLWQNLWWRRREWVPMLNFLKMPVHMLFWDICCSIRKNPQVHVTPRNPIVGCLPTTSAVVNADDWAANPNKSDMQQPQSQNICSNNVWAMINNRKDSLLINFEDWMDKHFVHTCNAHALWHALTRIWCIGFPLESMRVASVNVAA